jgi:hypothetical protein
MLLMRLIVPGTLLTIIGLHHDGVLPASSTSGSHTTELIVA